jgi:hypothetical protein
MISTEQLALRYGTDEELRDKEAGMMDTAGRMAAAVVLLRMLDSGRGRPDAAEHAKQEVPHTTRALEETPHHIPPRARDRRGVDHDDFLRRPRLFVPAQGTSSGDPESLRYASGFLPNAPMGMDDGTVRLASAHIKLAGMFSRAAQKLTPQLKTVASTPVAPAVPAPGPGLVHRARAWTADAITPSTGPGMIDRARTWTANRVAPAGHTPTPTPPPAPAGAPAPAPASDGWGMRVAKAAPGLAVLGAGAAMAVGLPGVTGKVLDYAEKEPAPTPWGLQSYGAPRVYGNINEYGQAVY